MKTSLLLFFIIFFSLNGFSQNSNENIEEKIKEYNKLLGDSLISQKEYNHLREKLIYGSEVYTNDSTEKAKENGYKFKIAGGSLFFGMGLSTIIGGIVYTKRNFPIYSKTIPIDDQLRNYKKNRIIIYSLGSTMAFTGAMFIGVGIFKKNEFAKQKNTSLTFNENGIGIRIGL